MDLGDFIFLILMGLGFLSSVGGAKKKRAQRRNPPRPTPPTPQREPQLNRELAEEPVRPTRRSRLQEARSRVKSQMEDLLRELEEQSKPPQAKLPLPPKPRVPRRMEPVVPSPVQKGDTFPDEIVERDGTLHQQFHDKYISPLSDPVSRPSRPRVQRLLNRRQQLREAVLMREILGPPKALE